jgi:hypothetical protein
MGESFLGLKRPWPLPKQRGNYNTLAWIWFFGRKEEGCFNNRNKPARQGAPDNNPFCGA